jgi:hypothetical protein
VWPSLRFDDGLESVMGSGDVLIMAERMIAVQRAV